MIKLIDFLKESVYKYELDPKTKKYAVLKIKGGAKVTEFDSEDKAKKHVEKLNKLDKGYSKIKGKVTEGPLDKNITNKIIAIFHKKYGKYPKIKEIIEAWLSDGDNWKKAYYLSGEEYEKEVLLPINDKVRQWGKSSIFKNRPAFNSNYEDDSIISEDEDGPGSSSDFVYKKDSGGGKPTMILKLGPQSWEKVKDLFDDQGRPGKDVSKIRVGPYVWSLYVKKYIEDGKIIHQIYGVAGDFTFGNAPTFYQQKYRGNIKVAKVVFDWFIKKYLSDSINEDEDGPGSSKLSHMSLGMKTTRVVISGDDVAANQEKILKLGQEMDPNFDAKFFPATGKIVGSMSQVKVQPLNLKLRDRKWKATAESKTQSQSLKK